MFVEGVDAAVAVEEGRHRNTRLQERKIIGGAHKRCKSTATKATSSMTTGARPKKIMLVPERAAWSGKALRW